MSLIVTRKRMPVSDLKINILNFGKKLSDGYFTFFPAQTPGDFNSPLGKNRAFKWAKNVEKKDKLMALLATLVASPIGWVGVFESPYNIFAWLFVIWGALGTWVLFSKTDDTADDNSEEIVELKAEKKEFKKDITFLKNEISEIKNQIEKLQNRK